MGKGSTTVQQSSSPPPQVLQQYQNVQNQANSVASNPYQFYPGQLVAGLTPGETSGISATENIGSALENPDNTYGLAQPYLSSAGSLTSDAANVYGGLGSDLSALENPNNTYGLASPYTNAASQLTTAGASPITAADINQYENPYLQQVGSTTSAELNQNNAIQQEQLAGSGAASGALGGDRVGVAQSSLANQQDLAENATLANINSQGYTSALGAAQTTNAQELQGGSLLGELGQTAENEGLASLESPFGAASTEASGLLGAGAQQAGIGTANEAAGTSALTSGLQGAGAQIQAGSLAQEQQQNELNAAYQQWEGSVQYPYEDTNFLSGVSSGLGSLEGGTSGTTYPAPSTFSQVVGGLTSISGIGGALKTGGRAEKAVGGASLGQATPLLLNIPQPQGSVAVGQTNQTGGGAMPQSVIGAGPPAAPTQSVAQGMAQEGLQPDGEEISNTGTGPGGSEQKGAFNSVLTSKLKSGGVAGFADGGGIGGGASGNTTEGQDDLGIIDPVGYLGAIPLLGMAHGSGAPHGDGGGYNPNQSSGGINGKQIAGNIKHLENADNTPQGKLGGTDVGIALGQTSLGQDLFGTYVGDYLFGTSSNGGTDSTSSLPPIQGNKRGGKVAGFAAGGGADAETQVPDVLPGNISEEGIDNYQILANLAPGAPAQKYQYQAPQGDYRRGGKIPGFATGGGAAPTAGAPAGYNPSATSGGSAAGMQGVSGLQLVPVGGQAGAITQGATNAPGSWSGNALPAAPQAATSLPGGAPASGNSVSVSAPSAPTSLSEPNVAPTQQFGTLTGAGAGQAIDPSLGVPDNYFQSIMQASPYYIPGTTTSGLNGSEAVSANNFAGESQQINQIQSELSQLTQGGGEQLSAPAPPQGGVGYNKRGGRIGKDGGGALADANSDLMPGFLPAVSGAGPSGPAPDPAFPLAAAPAPTAPQAASPAPGFMPAPASAPPSAPASAPPAAAPAQFTATGPAAPAQATPSAPAAPGGFAAAGAPTKAPGPQMGAPVAVAAAPMPQPQNQQAGFGQQPDGEPRGLRNNNPLNLKPAGYEFGVDGNQPTDGTFTRFQSPVYGIANATNQLMDYGNKGIDTVSSIVNTWVTGNPAGDGKTDTSKYQAAVSAALGVAPNAKINLSDTGVLERLEGSMWGQEEGQPPDMNTVVSGVTLGMQAAKNGRVQLAQGYDNGNGEPTSNGPQQQPGFAPQPNNPFQTPAQTVQAIHDAQQPAPQNPVPQESRLDKYLESPWAGLLATGLGILSGTSPYAAVNIGQGGLEGLQFEESMLPQTRARQQQTFDQQQTNAQNQFTQRGQSIQGGELANQANSNTVSAMEATPPYQQAIAASNAAPGFVPPVPSTPFGGPTPAGQSVPPPASVPMPQVLPQGGSSAASQVASNNPGFAPPVPRAAAPQAPVGQPPQYGQVAPPQGQQQGNAAQMLPPVALANGRISLPAQTPTDRIASLSQYQAVGGAVARLVQPEMDLAQGAVKDGKFVNQYGQIVNYAGSVGAAAQGTEAQNQANADSANWTSSVNAQPALNQAQSQLLDMASAAQAAPPNAFNSVLAGYAGKIAGVEQNLGITPTPGLTGYAEATDFLHKAQTQIAGQITQQYGQVANDSLRIIQAAVPNADLSSPASFAQVSRSLGQQAQLGRDLYNYGSQYRQAWIQAHPDNPQGWQQGFFDTHPPAMYASRVMPGPMPMKNGQPDLTNMHPGFNYTNSKSQPFQYQIDKNGQPQALPVNALGNSGQ
jgi:hypothetical protein